MRNNFNLLTEGLNWNVDVIMISETKMVETVSAGKFHIGDNTCPYRQDWNFNWGGIVIHVRENFSSKLFVIITSIEGIFIVLNLRKNRYILCGSFNPCKRFINLIVITKNVDIPET